jgi:hypothetical protein
VISAKKSGGWRAAWLERRSGDFAAQAEEKQTTAVIKPFIVETRKAPGKKMDAYISIVQEVRARASRCGSDFVTS